MKKRKHKALKEENDIFKYYKQFYGENIIDDENLGATYEQELIDLIKEKSKTKTLKEFIHLLEKENPYENGYVERENFDRQVEDRLTLIGQDKVKNTFSYMIGNKKGNSLETMIQRHIMLSNKYDKVLGKPLFYEFPCNSYNDNTEPEKRGKVPIDLITYDEKNKVLYLIELKKCRGKISSKNSNLSESKELFLRALLEVSTYYSFFTHLLTSQKKTVEKALSKVGGIDFKLSEVKEIRKAILAPRIVFDSVYTDELKEMLSLVDCFTIKTIDDDISNIRVNTKEEVFKIDRLN